MAEDQFPGSTDAQRRMQEHILNYIDLPMENCTCGCRGYPVNLLPPGSVDYKAYKTCPARLERTALPAYKAFKGSAEYSLAFPSANAERAKRQVERELAAVWRKAQKAQADRAKAAQVERERIAARLAEQERHKKGLPALSMDEAKRRKLKTYLGNPCAAGHCGERLARNGECVACRTADQSIREAMRRGAYPENLTQEERDEIVTIYAESRRISAESGIEHHVDHVIPLAAGGRHHPSNLQIIPAKANLQKGALHEGVRHRRSHSVRDSSRQLDVSRSESARVDDGISTEPEVTGFWRSLLNALFTRPLR